MPYKSRRQARFMHAAASRGEIAPSTVEEFDQATDFSKLPERKKRKKSRKKQAFDLGARDALRRFGF